VDDPQGRGIIYLHVVQFLRKRQPRCFILENVEKSDTEHSDTFNAMIDMLRSIRRQDYLVLWQVMNIKSYGVAQNRARVYIIGFRKNAMVEDFVWPARVDMAPLDCFLEVEEPADLTRFPRDTATVAYHNVCTALQKLLSKGINPLDCPSVCDHQSSKGGVMLGVSPCLSTSRTSNGVRWLMHCGKSMATAEMFNLQGLCPPRWVRPTDVSERQLRFAVGNAMLGNIMDLMLHAALPVSGVPLQGQSKWRNPKAATRSLI
jgi:hypothetical protein